MKKVEILLATFNGEPYLSEQLDSILSQDTQNWHLTASDDGSSDRTVEILDAYAQTYPEKITRVVSGRQFHNARDHFFWLMEQCDADYIQFCDQDDVWHPDKLRLLQEALEEAEAAYGTDTPLLAFSDQAVVDKDLGLIAPSLMTLQQQNPKVLDYRNLLYQNVVSGCTMAVNRPLAKLAAGIADSAVTFACKAHLRNARPVLLAISTNDALSGSAQNIGKLLNTRNIYFVPFRQDDPLGKPNSAVARFDLLPESAKLALQGRQIQPILLEKG